MAVGGKPIERRFKLRERARAVGDMGGVMFDEGAEHPIEFGLRAVAALGDERLFDHAAGAAADHLPGLLVGHGRQALAARG